MAYKTADIPKDFLISRQNVHHSPQDVPFGLWLPYYQEIARWISAINQSIAIRDPFTTAEYLMILFGLVQPGIQTRKDKWKDDQGIVREQYRIIWYRAKLEEIDNLIEELRPFIIRQQGMMPPWRFTKNDQIPYLTKQVHQLTKETRTMTWRLLYDMYSLGLTFPKSDDPARSLMKSQ